MELVVIIGLLGAIIGTIAGIVQVIQYFEERRERKRSKAAEKLAPSHTESVPPNNLIPRSEFFGRESEKSRVFDALKSRSSLIHISGIGGIGKTALALEVAYECLQARKSKNIPNVIPMFDGFIWSTAKNQELTLDIFLNTIARTLDFPGIIQQPLGKKIESVMRLFQEKACLIILDNFETVKDEEIGNFLLMLPEPTKVLITSRVQNPYLQAWEIPLKGLKEHESIALIREEGRRLGLSSLRKGEEELLLQLHAVTGGAPLAIRWAIGLTKYKAQSLDKTINDLSKAKKTDLFEFMFDRSWSLLSENARYVLMAMPLFSFSTTHMALKAATELSAEDLEDSISQLVELWLIEAIIDIKESQPRFDVHPLTRSFAQSKLESHEEYHNDAVRRLGNYYRNFLAERRPGKDLWYTMEGLNNIDVEWQNMQAFLNQCSDLGELDLQLNLILELANFYTMRGYWQDCEEYGKRAVDIAKQLHNAKMEARFLCDSLAWVYIKRGDLSQAELLVTKGLEIAKREDDNLTLYWGNRHLGQIMRERGRLENAEELFLLAMNIAEENNFSVHAGLIFDNLGALSLQRGDLVEAEKWYRQSIEQLSGPGLDGSLGKRLLDLGHIFSLKGNPKEAEKYFLDGLKSGQNAGRRDTIAQAKHYLALLREAEGNTKQALFLAREALEIYKRLSMQKEIEFLTKMIARLV